MYENLFHKGKIGRLELKNRFVMPPMDSGMTEENGEVSERLIAYYAARAKGGFGLIITEYTSVDYPDGMAKKGQLSLYDDRFIPKMKKLAEAVHREGSRIFIQLQHPGRETTSEITGRQTVSASAVPSLLQGKGIPRELRKDEIRGLTEKFAKAALRAKTAGMDGVEIQCGHGYLIAQFLSGSANKRTDEYGGYLLNRIRFAKEIIRAVKETCGSDFPVSCRVSGEERIPGGLSLQETIVIAKELERAGADAIHVSTGTVASIPWLIGPAALPGGFNLKAAKAIKQAVHIPVICVGRMTDPLLAEYALEETADFVSFGRASIADPELPNKIKEETINEIVPCVGCISRCFYTEGVIPGDKAISCMLNPFSGHEGILKITPAEKTKKVLVVGGGPGGLEAAWVAAARGHKVTLFEKDAQCGGQLRLAAIPPGKHEMAKGIAYLMNMNRKYKVDIRTDTEATLERIKEAAPEGVILATGAIPTEISLEYTNMPITQAMDILNGTEEPAQTNLIIGGGMVGLETALYIASRGYHVDVVEMQQAAGKDLNKGVRKFLFDELKEKGVNIFTSTRIENIENGTVSCITPDGKIKRRNIGKVISAVGSKPFDPLSEKLKESGCKVIRIGDAVCVRKAYAAIEEGARTALCI